MGVLVDDLLLLARLDQVRNSGFALSDQENVSGLRVLAAPVLDADGIPVAALSVAAPAFAIPLKTFSANRKPVMAAAAAMAGMVADLKPNPGAMEKAAGAASRASNTSYVCPEAPGSDPAGSMARTQIAQAWERGRLVRPGGPRKGPPWFQRRCSI